VVDLFASQSGVDAEDCIALRGLAPMGVSPTKQSINQSTKKI